MKKIVFILLLAVGGNIAVFSQRISGQVVSDETLEPVSYANIVLLQKADTSFVAGVVTDSIGRFELKTPSFGNKILKISYLGYKTLFLDVKDNDMGMIKLSPELMLLGEVVIKGPSEIHKFENAGISVNIQSTNLKNIGTASNVLGQLPFVHKSGNGYEVFGKGTPLIYINNRLIRNDSELDELNSSDIKKVTVITNPGAEYDGTVNAIIKIETNKKKGDGLSGSTSANVYLDREFSQSIMQNLNHRVKNWDIFGMFRFSNIKNSVNQDISQSIRYDETFTELSQVVKEENAFKNIKTNIGFNSTFGEENSFGAKYEFTRMPQNEGLIDLEAEVLKNKKPFEDFASVWKSDKQNTTRYLNAYFSGKMAPWLSVKVDGDALKGNTNNAQYVNNQRQGERESISTKNIQEYELYAGKMLLKTLLLGGSLSYGGEYSHTYNKQIFDVDEEGIARELEPNRNTSKQNLLATFAIYNKTFNKISIDVGLRYENMDFKYYDDNGKPADENNGYDNLFPNFGITYSGNKVNMMLSYRSTVQRPGYYQLRNSVQYDGPYTYEKGNPYLKPTRKNSLSYLFIWNKLKLSTVYTQYENRILFIPEQYKDDIIILYPLNIKNSRSLSFSAAYSANIGAWTPSLDVGVAKDFIKYGSPSQRFNKPAYTFRTRNNISLPYKTQIGLDASYLTGGNTSLSYIYNTFRTDVYFSKLLLKDKIRLNINGNDIFNTDRKKRKMEINDIVTYQNNDLNSCGVTISVTYNFNVIKSKYKGDAATNEINRL